MGKTKFVYCQYEIENEHGRCSEQCDHCARYYAPVEKGGKYEDEEYEDVKFEMEMISYLNQLDTDFYHSKEE